MCKLSLNFDALFLVDNGLWWTSKDNILSINPYTGVAIAANSGNTLVYYNASLSLPTYVEAKVTSVNEVNVVDPDKVIISNSPGPGVNGSYVVHVNFAKQRTTPLPGCEYPVVQNTPSAARLVFPFSCVLSSENSDGLSMDKVFRVEAGYDNGKSACFIFPKELTSVDAGRLSSSRVDLVLIVTLRDASKGTEISSGSVDLVFVPSFVLEKNEVKLSDNVDSASVELYGTVEMLQSLEVRIQYSRTFLLLSETRESHTNSRFLTLINSHATLVLV